MATTTSSIKPATLADLPAILSLTHICFRGEESLKGWTTERGIIGGNRTTLEQLRKEAEQEGFTFLKYEDENGNIIGVIYAHHHVEEGTVSTGMLSIHPDHQSKGLGKQMFAAVEALAKEKNCQSVKMHVVSVRDKLMGWYERLGYKRTGRVDPFPENSAIFGTPLLPGLTLLELEKPLL